MPSPCPQSRQKFADHSQARWLAEHGGENPCPTMKVDELTIEVPSSCLTPEQREIEFGRHAPFELPASEPPWLRGQESAGERLFSRHRKRGRAV
jgi:hypothetical protein